MKSNCLILTVLVISCILFLQVSCQESPRVTEGPETMAAPKPVAHPEEPRVVKSAPSKEVPKITFKETTYDFGEVGPGTKNACEFKFTNTGDSLLKITDVKVGAPCCIRYTLAKREYAPGESGTLEVRYNASKYSGQVRHTVVVSSDDASRPKVTLIVKAKVALKVVHKPKELKLLLRGKNAGCPEITLTSVDKQPFAIRSFSSTGNCITASFDSSRKATEFVLQPKINVERLKKRLSGRIMISLTHPECDLVTIPFSAIPEFEITPRSLVVLDAKPQTPIIREVWILSNYREDFEVESASSEKGVVKVLSQEKHGNSHKFELEITPPAAGDNKGIFTDVFYVYIKGGEKLEVNCRGFYSRNEDSR